MTLARLMSHYMLPVSPALLNVIKAQIISSKWASSANLTIQLFREAFAFVLEVEGLRRSRMVVNAQTRVRTKAAHTMSNMLWMKLNL